MESLHRFLDKDKDNGIGEMGVIIYGSFLISNFHYGRGGGKATRAWKHMQKWVKGGQSPRSYSNWGLCGSIRGDWDSCSSSFHCSFRNSCIQSCSHGLVWWLRQHVLQNHWRSADQLQQGTPPLPLSCHLLGWIFYSSAEKKEHPLKPIRDTKHDCILIYTNVHPYILFMQSKWIYYIMEAINIQIFLQDYPQTMDSEHNCKITSYDRINKS